MVRRNQIAPALGQILGIDGLEFETKDAKQLLRPRLNMAFLGSFLRKGKDGYQDQRAFDHMENDMQGGPK
jgi:hypothetical protein